LRYTRAKRRNHFISFISLISMLGLTLGVSVLILVLSVMNGFDQALKTRILGVVPQATISTASGRTANWQALARQAQQNPQVIATAPFIQAQGMLTAAGQVRGVWLYGMSPALEAKVSIIKAHMTAGQYDIKPGSFDIILGDSLATQLGLVLGSKVTLVLPETSVTPFGVYPRLKTFTLAGTFTTGSQLDDSLALINIKDAARLLRLGKDVQGIRLKVKDLFQAPAIARNIARQLPGVAYRVSDWTQTNGNLFQAIKMEKRIMSLLLLLIVAVAAFNIVSSLVMVVTDKKADIAILRTLGASPRTIMGIFMVQGTVIGLIGTLIGVILGVIAALTISDIVAWFERITGEHLLQEYFVNYLPSQLEISDVLIITLISLAISFVATLYPALQAARTQPAEALRYE
jgi:lipoprotein-releasing system permease protein